MKTSTVLAAAAVAALAAFVLIPRRALSVSTPVQPGQTWQTPPGVTAPAPAGSTQGMSSGTALAAAGIAAAPAIIDALGGLWSSDDSSGVWAGEWSSGW